MTLTAKTLTGFLLCSAGLSLSTVAEATPSQLYNKTISLSYDVGGAMIGRDGRTIDGHRAVNYVLYVSSQGRLFSRSARYERNASRKRDIAPGRGPSGALHFAGNTIVGVMQQPSGAARMTISFDPGFRTCHAEFIFGRANGEMMRIKTLDGSVREMTGKMTASNVQCSIRDGNPFNGD